jgi:hypothetical protein
MARTTSRGGGNRSRSNRDDWGVMELARERPLAAAAVAAGAAATGLFLWSKRAQISQQLSGLSDQIGAWSQISGDSSGHSANDHTGGLTTTSSTSRGRARAPSTPTS